jgi:hypothetical protein
MNMYCCYDNKQLLINQYTCMYIFLYFEKIILILFSFYNDATSFINVTTIDKMVPDGTFTFVHSDIVKLMLSLSRNEHMQRASWWIDGCKYDDKN